MLHRHTNATKNITSKVKSLVLDTIHTVFDRQGQLRPKPRLKKMGKNIRGFAPKDKRDIVLFPKRSLPKDINFVVKDSWVFVLSEKK